MGDGTTPPASLDSGALAINEPSRILYLKTFRGSVAVPLDRMALEAADPNASDEVFVYRDSLIAESVILSGGGGANYRDDRIWRIFGVAPESLSSSGAPVQGLFEVNFPITIQSFRVRVLSGNGALQMKIYNWADTGLGTLVIEKDVDVSGAGGYIVYPNVSLDPGRYAAVLTGDSGITVETLVGIIPWLSDTQSHGFSMSEVHV